MLCRRGARDNLCQVSLCTAYYQGAQCSRLCRTRAESVCSIKWIRRHGTFPSCRLRRKLHSPFSYVAGDATSYVWHRPDKTAPGHDERGTPGAGKGFQERDPRCLRRHNVGIVCYSIPHQLGPPVGDPTAMYAPPLRYKREALARHGGTLQALTHTGSIGLS